MRVNLHFKKKKKAQAGNELSNILPKSSHEEKASRVILELRSGKKCTVRLYVADYDGIMASHEAGDSFYIRFVDKNFLSHVCNLSSSSYLQFFLLSFFFFFFFIDGGGGGSDCCC